MAILRYFRPAILLLTAAAALSLSVAYAQAQDAANVPGKLYEQKVKAGLVYNFLKFTTWPESSFSDGSKTIRVCLFGQDPFDGYLYPLEGRTAQQYTIQITQVSTLQKIDGCHLIFVHNDEEQALPDVLSYLNGRNILTMSDINNFSRQGGMVELSKQQDQRIHILINKKKVDAAGLDLESRILRLAKLVD